MRVLRVLELVFLLLSIPPSWAQSVSFGLSSGSGAPGGTVALNLSANSTPGSEPAGVQWALNYPAADFSAVQITDGPAATAAGKAATCAAGAGSLTCLSIGINTNTLASGVVAIATFTISPTTSSTSSSIQVSNTVAASLGGSGIPTSGGSGVLTISRPAALNALSCSPLAVNTPGASSCTVSLTAPAPAATAVTLASNNANLTVPSPVTLSAGSSSAGFTATAAQVGADATATLTATLGADAVTFPVTLVSPPGASSLSCSPGTVTGGASTLCAVTLTKAAPDGGTVVTLSSNSPKATVPSSVAVPAGATAANLTATTGPVSAATPATISASTGGATATASLTINPVSGATSTTLSSSVNPSVFGQAVTLAAQVSTTAGGATPTGTVTFYDGGTTLGTGALNGSGQATLQTAGLTVKPHSITAVYGGNASFVTSTSTALTQTVNKATTTAALVSSVNPALVGQAVTFTATVSVTAPGAGTRTGTVTFRDGSTSLGTATLAGSSASFTTSTLANGAHQVTAQYSGDAAFNGSTSPALKQTVRKR